MEAQQENLWTRIQTLRDYLTANGRNNRFVRAGVPGINQDVASGYNKFDLCVNSLTDKVYECFDTAKGAAVWVDTNLTLNGVTEAGKEVFVVGSQAAQLALDAYLSDVCIRMDTGDIYVRNAGTSGTISDWTKVAVGPAQTTVINSLLTYLRSGLLQVGSLAISATAEKFKTTAQAIYRLAGIQRSKDAADDLVFTANDTINVAAATGSFFGVWLVQIDASGVITTKSPAADQVYASAPAALAALPAPDAGNIALGSIVIGAKADSAWTANTDDMTPASDCASAAFADASVVSVPSNL